MTAICWLALFLTLFLREADRQAALQGSNEEDGLTDQLAEETGLTR